VSSASTAITYDRRTKTEASTKSKVRTIVATMSVKCAARGVDELQQLVVKRRDACRCSASGTAAAPSARSRKRARALHEQRPARPARVAQGAGEGDQENRDDVEQISLAHNSAAEPEVE